MKFIILDSETTGLSNDDELIEIALILAEYDSNTDKLTKLDEYSGLRCPDCSVSRKATEIHGLTKRKLKGHDLDIEKIENLFEQAEFVICHNVKFDIRFVVRVYVPSAKINWFCTMEGIPWRSLGFSNCKLQDLLNYHGVSTEQAHRAMSDTIGLFSLLKEKNNKTGKSYFSTLMESEPFSIDLNISYESESAKEKYGHVYGEENAKGTSSGCLGSLLVLGLGFLLSALLIIKVF